MKRSRRQGTTRDNGGEQGFWPSYTDMMSAVALILFFLMLLAYIQNMITDNDLKGTKEELTEALAQLSITSAEVEQAQKELEVIFENLELARKDLDAQQLHIDAAGFADGLVIGGGAFFQVGGIAVRHMDSLGTDVHMAKKLLVHEAVIAAFVVFGNAHIFIQIEGGHLGKIHHAPAVQVDQTGVGGNGRGARGQPQHAVGLAQQLRGQQHRRRLTHLLRGIKNANFHPMRLRSIRIVTT